MKEMYLYLWWEGAIIVAENCDKAREIWTGNPAIVAGEPRNVYMIAPDTPAQVQEIELVFASLDPHDGKMFVRKRN